MPDFAGTYVHPFGFPIDLKFEENKLLISEGGDFMKLILVAGNRFKALGLSTPVSFKHDNTGTVIEMISSGLMKIFL